MLTRPIRAGRGFSLIELMVTVALMGIVMAMALPSFSAWIKNSQVRTVADALQSGLRLSQSEAVRRYQQVVFFRTADKTCSATAAASVGGPFWQIRTVASVAGGPAQVVQCGALTEVASDIALAGPTALCFNSDGRQVANAAPGPTGASCAPAANGAASTFDVTHANANTANRKLRVLVSLAGSVRMCDPDRAFPTYSDGCPVVAP